MRDRIVLYLCLLCLWAGGLNAQTRKNLEKERNQTLRQIAQTTELLQKNQDSHKISLSKYNLLSAQIEQYNKLIATINAEIQFLNAQIITNLDEVERYKKQVAELKREYAQMVNFAYKNRQKYNQLIFILAAEDLNTAYRRMRYFQQYSSYRQLQVAKIESLQDSLNVSISRLEAARAEKEELLNSEQEQRLILAGLRSVQNQELQDLRSKERQLRAQLEEQQKRERQLQEEIQKLIAAENKKRNKGKEKSSKLYDKLTPEEQLTSKNFSQNKGKLPWPTEKGVISRPYGISKHPVLKDITIDNDGIDIMTNPGSAVRAVFDGEVSFVSAIIGENLTIFIRHGNYITIYQNVVRPTVKQGDKVKTKQVIGYTVNDKDSKSVILHFGVWNETVKQNPSLWLAKP